VSVEVKFCGIKTLEHARLASQIGADYLGFVFYEKSIRYVSPEDAARIADQLRGHIKLVGVFVNENPERLNEVADLVGLDLVQLSGDEKPEVISYIRKPVIKAIHVLDAYTTRSRVEIYKPLCEMILLDTYSKDKMGGTGRVFDWSIAREISAFYPVMLAGGLSPANVQEAIRMVRPKAVDVSSGIETDGVKDPIKMKAFIEAVKGVEV